MNTRTQIAALRAKLVARMGDVERAVRILLAVGIAFAQAVRYCLACKQEARKGYAP